MNSGYWLPFMRTKDFEIPQIKNNSKILVVKHYFFTTLKTKKNFELTEKKVLSDERIVQFYNV